MKTKPPVSRRVFLASAAGFLATSRLAAAAACQPTPRQGEGPYYPEGDLNRDNDLTFLRPGIPAAQGQVIFLSGVVKGRDCKPVPDAVVEIWQAAASGKYNHSQDPNNLPLDPNFQYWGRTRTDAQGRYLFKTIIPGHYPTGPGTFRPPHIHVKVHGRGFFSLTTQVYFDPRSYDDVQLGRLVQQLNQAEGVPSSLTVLYRDVAKSGSGKVKAGVFDFTLTPN